MARATQAQIIHINGMFLGGALSRAQFEEFNKLALAGRVTKEIAQKISEGKFKFQSRLSDAHLAKVRTVWEKLGKRVFGGTFEKYLNGTDALEAIPLPPSWPSAYLTRFDREVLVDGRVLERIGLTETCKLAGLVYCRKDDAFETFEPTRAKTGVRWMRAQDGRKNRSRMPVDCRKTFEKYEVGMAADEGVFTYVDDVNVIEGHYLDLPGSVLREDRGSCACLGAFVGGPELSWRWNNHHSRPRYGSASRGE